MAVNMQVIPHGGGFSYGERYMWMEEYVLDLCGKERPKVLFLPHTTDDAIRYCELFYRQFSSLGVMCKTLSLFHIETGDLRSYILDNDIVIVGGGNTKSLMALWHEWGVDEILREAYRNGIVLSGLSAGAICWFEAGFSDSIPGQLTEIPCTGILQGLCNPHSSGERKQNFEAHLIEKSVPLGLGIPDGSLLHFVNGELARAFADGDDMPVMYLNGSPQSLDVQSPP